jgi:ubiquinone/menaquinone biosynthesis C-methylase UbiE
MFSSPDENLSNINLHSGQVVADLGSGSGFHAISAAKMVGESGTVYAIEIQKDLLNTVKTRAEEEGLSNVKVIWGDIDSPGGIKLADETCDVVIMANVFFQVQDKNICVAEASRILKEGGKLILIDWKESLSDHKVHKFHVIKLEEAKPYFVNAGFLPIKEFDAKAHHYGIVFIKK